MLNEAIKSSQNMASPENKDLDESRNIFNIELDEKVINKTE